MAKCCCGGCGQIPFDHALAQDEFQALTAYCCACIPKQICATYACSGGESAAAILSVSNDCTNPDTSQRKTKWVGQIVVDSQLIDVELSFKVVGTDCYVCLTADYFGAAADTVNDCILIDDAVRAVICPTCQGSPQDPLVFDISSPSCGTYATLSVLPAANLSVTAWPDCCDRPDPCAAIEGESESTLKTCTGPCTGCSCICECACVTIIVDGEATTEQVCACNWKWHLSNGMFIELKGDEGGCCVLSLDTGDVTPTLALTDVDVGGIDNPCPQPAAEWEFTASGGYSESYHIIWNCVTCDDCEQVVVQGYGCCGGAATVPKILTATVDGGGDCCGEFTLTMVYDPDLGTWVGYHPTAFCDHEIRLTLACGAEWTLQLDALGGCTQETVTADSATCEPMYLTFTMPASGVGCCDLTAGGYDLAITITE